MTDDFRTAIILLVLLLGAATPSFGVPVFYLSNQPLGVATPGILQNDFFNAPPGTPGQLGIYVTTDVRLSGISLDLIEVGGAIKFTGATVLDPPDRWEFLDGPLTIQNSQIKSMGGAAIPFPLQHGNGIGPGSPELPDPTSGYLIATVNYEVTNLFLGSSNLFLKVGSNLIPDFEGNSPPVIFGPGSPPTPTRFPGGTDSMPDGQIQLGIADDFPPRAQDATIDAFVPEVVNEVFSAIDDDTPQNQLVWSGFEFLFEGGDSANGKRVTGAADPAFNVTTREFNWPTAGWKPGMYTASARVTEPDNVHKFDIATLTINLSVPEPASAWLAGLAIANLACVVRRRTG